MEKYRDAADLVRQTRPDRPVLAFRPHAARRATRWFQQNFPGTCLYAVKANDAPHMLAALHEAGIRDYDVASLAEIEALSGLDGARAHVMHPVKSREFIRRAYFDHGIRTFALDSETELAKIVDETGGARDLTLLVRMACAGTYSEIPLEDKFGASWHEAPELLRKTRQAADQFGLTFHVGSQAMATEAFGHAMRGMSHHIVQAGVVIDILDVGGGFPSVYPGMEPPALASYVEEIAEVFDQIEVGNHCELWAEPGRALVAEAEAAILHVDARKGGTLYVNDGSFGVLYDAAHLPFRFPARRIGLTDGGGESHALAPFSLYGPTCDAADFMQGPFYLPADMAEGDYIEVGNIGAYGRVMATRFNGFGNYIDAELDDEPMLSAYGEADYEARPARPVRQSSGAEVNAALLTSQVAVH